MAKRRLCWLLQDLGNIVPGVQIARTGTDVQRSVRGVSSGVVGSRTRR